MKIQKTGDPSQKPSIVMCVYGDGGVGKSTFAATAPKPLMLDFEYGSKYFGLRGINIDVVHIKSWKDVEDPELLKVLRGNQYETIVIDPIGEAMLKLKAQIIAQGDKKYVQGGGDLSMAGWGHLKERMRSFMKFLRDSGKHILFVAHVDETEDEGRVLKHPKIETKIYQELINMVDLVGYMYVKVVDDKETRMIMVQPNDKYSAKDRTGTLDRYIAADFKKIVSAIDKSKKAWEKPQDDQEGDEDVEDEDSSDEAPETPAEDPTVAKKKVLAAKRKEIKGALETKG